MHCTCNCNQGRECACTDGLAFDPENWWDIVLFAVAVILLLLAFAIFGLPAA